MRKIEAKLSENAAVGPATARRTATELSNYQLQIEQLDRDIAEIQARMREREQSLADHARVAPAGGNQRQPHESQRDFLIRTGKITPFSKFGPELPAKHEDTLRDALLNAEAGPAAEFEPPHLPAAAAGVERSHRVLQRPGFADAPRDSSREPARGRPAAKKRRTDGVESSPATGESSAQASLRATPLSEGEGSDYTPATSVVADARPVRSDGGSDDDSGDDTFLHKPAAGKAKTKARGKGRVTQDADAADDTLGVDDGNEDLYQARLRNWIERRKHAREKAMGSDAPLASDADGNVLDEWHQPHPTAGDFEIDNAYHIPGDVYPSLFDYQRTGVQWLWELYAQSVGGIVGDEMGLGKTVQVIAFLAGLHYSRKITRPTIVVAPATVMKQWVNEFHTWWPPFRVSILHASGSGMVDVGREARREEELLRSGARAKPPASTKAQRTAKTIVDRAVAQGHVLVTTYAGLQTYAELLVPVQWEYAVLDEGHKIRNPNAGITLFCKELRTPHRIILSGTPIQNHLVELWSLFDFIFPMRLGTLVDFKDQFDIPIRIGGYANASNLQIQTANKCAEALKDAISPYLLQRLKADVAADLPPKTERVLFCKLTKPQRDAYESFLAGDDIRSIFAGKRNVLFGVDVLRKICNHPDLQDHKTLAAKPDYPYGAAAKSGKMVIVKELLDIWTRGGHKTLLFAQHRIMLDILEKYLASLPGIRHRRMDGNTPIAARQALVDEFNRDPAIHVFLLTTKVGGLGVNLTGADRVIIFDPDWNPSTDVQARERAWRLGQTRAVEIYRLMVAGTIEEKIFHRQIFKQVLTNKILQDPKQRQTFQMQDLHDLFALGDAAAEGTETGKLFAGAEVRFDAEAAASDARPAAPAARDDPRISDLDGVASVRPFDASAEPPSSTPSPADAPAAPAAAAHEQRLLAGIFQRSGVHAALEHDTILNGRRTVTADPRVIEAEAQRVAADAARALRAAETAARALPAGVPTWTGQFGTAGRPEPAAPRGGAGPSSASILAGLQTRGAGAGGTASRGGSGGRASVRRQQETAARDFARRIRDFLRVHGGRAYTQMLIDHFNRSCTTPALTAQFKASLRELATLQRGSRGRGSWVLKEEYRAAA